MSHVIYAARLEGEDRLGSSLPVHHTVCVNNFAYGDGLHELWPQEVTIVNVEHDMEFSDALAQQLLECPHSLCTHAYQMHIPRDYYAHGWLPREKGLASQASCIRWIRPTEEWVDYSAVGFCKIAPEARQRHELAEDIPWMAVEPEVNAAVAGLLWHVHWPEIEHYHYREL